MGQVLRAAGTEGQASVECSASRQTPHLRPTVTRNHIFYQYVRDIMKKSLLIVVALTALLALTSSQTTAAPLTLGSRVLVSSDNGNFDISVFDGTASYNDRGLGGDASDTVTFTNPLGDGTVLDYNFFYSPTVASVKQIVSYADGGAGRIPLATSPAANINGDGEDWSDVWTTTDPGVAFSTTKDFTNGTVPKTFARSANVTGSIDISGLESGTVYFPHGTFINQWAITLTMTGSGQLGFMAVDEDTSNGPGTNKGWITDFTFDNTGGLYDTIEYHYTNADTDGSRARFMGVILDGVVVPEPATMSLLALGGLALLRRRRRN
jgi:hypothetical protein